MMKEKIRHETEKMHNNEPSPVATFQGDFERIFDELRAILENLHTEQESSKKEECMDRTKLEEQQCTATTALITAYKEGMETEVSNRL